MGSNACYLDQYKATEKPYRSEYAPANKRATPQVLDLFQDPRVVLYAIQKKVLYTSDVENIMV